MNIQTKLPAYKGEKWVIAQLPQQAQSWQLGRFHSTDKDNDDSLLSEELSYLLQKNTWSWPKQPIFFFSDLHADSDAFWASLVASGGIKKTGKADKKFKLTQIGRKARFIIGGDCFDKGASNLRLLRSIRLLIDSGAKVNILAGNHDIRTKLGMRAVDLNKDPKSEHFFIRMGSKVVPLLKEIQQEYLQGKNALKGIPDEAECRRRLYPSDSWFDEFPIAAIWMMPEKTINKEIKRLREKISQFEHDCKKEGLCLRTVYAATLKWQQLFLHPKGEFYWYFKKMSLMLKKGSFLFVHAGLDDRIASMINKKGLKHLNRQFKHNINEELFEFYYGPLANTIRTKYREIDMPLSKHGVKMINDKGIYALVHGHKNMRYGQRIMLRKGIVNFECDASVDLHTRNKESLGGHGAAVTIFSPKKIILGISTDYPYIKVFDPKHLIK
ncbi:MAG: metallophosphoesterase [Methylococcaceae bacterium]|nr:metallophosphoesterase [Methylococcaceae bacterium]